MANLKLNLAQAAKMTLKIELIERSQMKHLVGGGIQKDPPPIEEF
ncbi:MAG: hypothetical protein AAFP19_04155 [Bacteroidota bacterium]